MIRIPSYRANTSTKYVEYPVNLTLLTLLFVKDPMVYVLVIWLIYLSFTIAKYIYNLVIDQEESRILRDNIYNVLIFLGVMPIIAIYGLYYGTEWLWQIWLTHSVVWLLNSGICSYTLVFVPIGYLFCPVSMILHPILSFVSSPAGTLIAHPLSSVRCDIFFMALSQFHEYMLTKIEKVTKYSIHMSIVSINHGVGSNREEQKRLLCTPSSQGHTQHISN